MKTAWFMVLMVLMVGGIGCNGSMPDGLAAELAERNTVSEDGVELTIALAQRELQHGQAIKVGVLVQNATTQDITVKADSEALCKISLWRHTWLGWERMETWPESAMEIRSDWILKAGQSRTFQQSLLVGKDWPTHEPLRLTAELAGKPDLLCPMVIGVSAASQE